MGFFLFSLPSKLSPSLPHKNVVESIGFKSDIEVQRHHLQPFKKRASGVVDSTECLK
jgi:hypothetical protein